jgi:hypothetical protein
MRKRKIEFAVILVVVALCGFLAQRPAEPESRVLEAARPVASLKLRLPKVQLSEDARWLLTTAADSYAPRVPLEKSWEEPGEAQCAPSR